MPYTSNINMNFKAFIILLAVSTAFVHLAGCSHSSTRTRGARSAGWKMDGTPELRLHQFILQGWNINFGKNSTDAQRVLGPPSRTHRKSVENNNPIRKADTDVVLTLEYPGLQIKYYVTLDSPSREFLLRVFISDKKYTPLWGLGVGTPATRIITVLGSPKRLLDDSSINYELDGDSVVFGLSDGHIKNIEWERYLD